MRRRRASAAAALADVVLALAGCAAPAASASARAPRPSTPPVPTAAARLALPPTASFQFGDGPAGNGMVADVASLHELPLLTALVVVPGGARAEPAEKAGLASFTAGLLDEGAGGEPAGGEGAGGEGAGGMSRAEFLAALDRLGARFAAQGGADDVTLALSFRACDLDAGLDLLFAAAFAPNFPTEAVEKARVRTLGLLLAARDDEEALAHEVLFARLFPGHAYARPIAGEEKTVETFTRDDVVAFHQAAFAPAKLRVVVAGDVAPDAAVAAIARAAGRRGVGLGTAHPRTEPLRQGDPPLTALPRQRTLILVHKPGVAEPRILFGSRAPLATNGDATALIAANVPFGGCFTSALVDRLRVDLGLTYDAGSSLERLAEASVFSVHAGTQSERVGTLLDEAFAQLDRLKRGELDEAALARAKSTLTTETVVELETTDGVAGLLRESALLQTGPEAVARFGRELDALTLAQVKAAVARHLPDSNQIVCVVVGDRAELETELARFGPVEVVDGRTLRPLAPASADANANADVPRNGKQP